MATARTVIFPQPTETGNRVDLGILKFGTWSLAFRSAVIFGETGQMCPDTENPPKVLQI
jgi:hypothetical protein